MLPGLIECHSHPLFAGSRHAEYAKRLAGASLAEIAAAGGGIWASVLATREASDDQLTAQLAGAYRRILAGGVTTLEVKSGYGLTAETELHQLELLAQSRSLTPLQLMISFLGAHVVPAGMEAEAYTDDVLAMLETVVAHGHRRLSRRHLRGGPVHARAGAADAPALARAGDPAPAPTPTPGPARRAGRPPSPAARCRPSTSPTRPTRRSATWAQTDTVAVLLPQAELVYMTDRRANARLFIDTGVPGGDRHRLLLLDPRHLADRDDRARRAVVPDHAGRGDRGRDAQRRLRAARRRRPRLDRPAASAATSRSCPSTIPRSCAWPSARTSSPR